jgi:hypothetical protein
MKRRECVTAVALVLLCHTAVYSQQSTNSAGGVASGAGGSVNYSVGQLGYTAISGAGGSLEEGVEQGRTLGILPVTLLHFTARCKEAEVQLAWQTATEINNAFFNIEKSTQTGAWETIAKIPGAGNSTVIRSYAYSDKLPGNAYNLYRLKQVDFDGHFEYSPIAAVNSCNESPGPITCYPNPATSGVFLDLKNNGNICYELFDLCGKKIANGILHTHVNYLPLTGKGNGIYLVRLFQGETEIKTFKILKSGK